jgi:N-formylglutamate deformylase
MQLELTQSTYMQEALPFAYDETRAAEVQPLLEKLLTTALEHVTAA